MNAIFVTGGFRERERQSKTDREEGMMLQYKQSVGAEGSVWIYHDALRQVNKSTYN